MYQILGGISFFVPITAWAVPIIAFILLFYYTRGHEYAHYVPKYDTDKKKKEEKISTELETTKVEAPKSDKLGDLRGEIAGTANEIRAIAITIDSIK